MKKYEIAVFDVDGTLLDTTEGVLAAVRYTIKENNLPELTEQQLKTFIGPPIQDSFEKYYHFDNKKLQNLADCFRNRYKDIDLLKARPYDGIYETFEKLKAVGIKLAIATYKRQDYARRLLDHFGFNQYTSTIYGADNFNRLKKKDIIIKCMNDLDVFDYSKAVMIGDSDNDAIGAQAIGMNFLGVTYGFGFVNEEEIFKYPAIGCANKASEIAKYFI